MLQQQQQQQHALASHGLAMDAKGALGFSGFGGPVQHGIPGYGGFGALGMPGLQVMPGI